MDPPADLSDVSPGAAGGENRPDGPNISLDVPPRPQGPPPPPRRPADDFDLDLGPDR